MKKKLTSAALIALLPAALAQTSTRQTSRMTPEMRARMEQMRPVMNLAETVRMLPELEKNKATAMSRVQAGKLLTLIGTLQKATTIRAAEAKKYLAQIEDSILTDSQLTALDTLMLRAEEQRRAERAKRQASGGTQVRMPGMPGLPAMTGQRPGAQNGSSQNAQRQPFDPSKFNPFKEGRTADTLKAYVAVLKKK